MRERIGTIGFLRLFILVFAILIVQNNYAQAPAGYYDSAIGTGAALKSQLYNIIKNHTVRSYPLWAWYDDTDLRPDGKIWDIYTNTCNFTYGTNQCGNYSSVCDCYNNEHSFPKSWFNDASPMNSDIFHIYPTDGKVNGMRSNYPYGETNGTSWGNGKLGSCTFPGYTGTVFEPADEYKGDLARTYFYMATRYENVFASWENYDANGNAMMNGTSYPCFESWALSLLLKWHQQDPVSQKEIDRNNKIYSVVQFNRNPFIDHPEYVAKIWGGVIENNPPSISGITLNPASPKSTDPVNVSAIITDTDGIITSAVLKWGLVSGSFTNSINLNKTTGNSYTTVSAIPAKSDGVTVYYKLEAADDSGDVTITSQYSYTVNDNFYNVVILNESFTNCPPAGWLTYSISSNKNWTCGSGYELINGFGGDVASNDWLISPLVNLDGYHNEYISFQSWTKYTDEGNHPAIRIKYSTDYSGTGNPILATWAELTATWPAANSQIWVKSGNIDVSSIKGTQVYFAFQYISTGTGSTNSSQWEIDSVKIVGDDISTNSKPQITGIVKNPENPITGQSVNVSANITDTDGSIFSSKIKWGTVSGSYPNTINMSASGNIFSGVIPSQLAGTIVYFVVEATDNDNSKTTSAQQQYFVSEIPNVAPVISGIMINPSAPSEGEPITVTASITDSDGSIASAFINYGTSSGNYTQLVSMINSGNTYSGTIPSQLSGTAVYFIIEATDDDSEESLSVENSFLVTAPHNYPPGLNNIQYTPTNPDQNQTVLVSAEVADADGSISFSKIKWGTTQGSYPNRINMVLGSGVYSGIIPGQIGGTNIYFRIVAADNDNDSTVSNEYSYVVNTPSNINPVISNLNFVPIVPTSTQTVSVSATITDTDGTILFSKIKWGTLSGVYSNQIPMSSSEGTFSGTIPSQANTTQIYFVVEATDNSGGVTISSEQNYMVTNPPNINPEITNISFVPVVPTSIQQVVVFATITDTDGIVTNANLKWGTSVGTYTNIVSMSKNTDVYTGSIPARQNNIHIYFVVEAIDNDGGSKTSEPRDYIVTDPVNVLPQITNVSFAPFIPTSLQDVIVKADITDTDGSIISATVKWGETSGSYGNAVGMSSASEEFTAVIPAQPDGTRIYFIIEAIDNGLGIKNSAESNFLVIDPPNQAPVISNIQISPSNPTNIDSVLISAAISDIDGTISSALLKWKRDFETAVSQKEMIFHETLYQAYIPAQEAGKTIYFMIVATDNDLAQTQYLNGSYVINAANEIEYIENEIKIMIYPNPIKDVLNMQFSELLDGCIIVIYDVLGIEILKKEIKSSVDFYSIDFSKVKRGNYFLVINTKKGILSKKIVVN